MDIKRFSKDGLPIGISKAGAIIISFLNLLLLARIFTTEQMGQYSLLLMILNLALILGLNWSDSSIVRHGREEYTVQKKINQSFWARMLLFIPMMALFILLFFIFREPITAYIGVEAGIIWWIIAMFILNGIMNFLILVFQSTDQMKRSAVLSILQKALYLVVLAYVFFTSPGTVPLEWIIIILNATFLLSVIIIFAYFDFSMVFPVVLCKDKFKVIWEYSWPQLIGFSGLYLINYIDLYFIKKYLTLTDLGVYSVAYNIFTSVGLMVMVWYTVTFPLIVEYKTKKDKGSIRAYLKRLPLYAGIAAIVTLAGIIVSRFAMPILFSHRYDGAIPSLSVLLIAGFFYFISIYLLPIVNAFDLILFSQLFNLVKAGVNIYLDYLLIPKLGIIGAAYGTLASYIVGAALTLLLIFVFKKKVISQHA